MFHVKHYLKKHEYILKKIKRNFIPKKSTNNNMVLSYVSRETQSIIKKHVENYAKMLKLKNKVYKNGKLYKKKRKKC